MSGYEIIVRRLDGSPPVVHQVTELELFAVAYALDVARRAVIEEDAPLLADATPAVAKELVLTARKTFQRLGLLPP